MRFVRFNDDKISKLALGGAQFGLKYGIANKNNIPTKQETKKIIDHAYENGINLFDTAQIYGDSEDKIGSSLGTRKSFVVSKITSKDFYTKDIIESSLIKTQQKSLFVLLLHDSNLLKIWGEKEKNKILSLKKNKKIKYFGISIYNDSEFTIAVQCKEIDSIEVPFSIFDQRAIKCDWIQKAKKYNKLLIIRSVFLQGLLLIETQNAKSSFAYKYIKQFSQISQKLNISKIELALSFTDTLVPKSIILFGCDNIQQITHTIRIYNNFKALSNQNIQILIDLFSDIPESIYNPTKWN